MAVRLGSKTLALALLCLLAAHGAVEASRMGPSRKLSQVGAMGGVYAWNGDGIVVVNTVIFVSGVAISDSGYYADGTNCYLEGGIYFGVIYGGIIYPPNGAQYYPPAIVAVVVFGPVFAQSWFFGPTGVIVWSMTIFYRPGGVRIWNPAGYNGPFYNSAGVQLGTFSNSAARITSNTVITQNNINVINNPPPRQVTTPAAAGKSPISSAVGQSGVTVSPGAAPGFSPGDAGVRPGSPAADRSGSPGARAGSPGFSGSPADRGISGSPADASRRSGSPAAQNAAANVSPAGQGGRSPIASNSAADRSTPSNPPPAGGNSDRGRNTSPAADGGGAGNGGGIGSGGGIGGGSNGGGAGIGGGGGGRGRGGN